ncbi:MAG: aldo/keto reductase [Oscillospiraceae bacterium]|nr:aldo/keto reductase [Oscillospiraceae bacterium]
MSNLVNDCMKLGFGMMRLPRLADNKIDIEQTKRMVDAFMAAGGKYFDTAFTYEGSEDATGKALCSRYPRESYYLATKLNASEFACKSVEDARREIEISLERTGAEYIDFYLLHGLDHENKARYEKYGAWEYVRELKERGLIKHYGFSFHDTPEELDILLNEHPDAEFVQLQINYADWETPTIESRRCYEVACAHGKPVIVMEPVKGGTLADPPESVKRELQKQDPKATPSSWAIRFAASLDNVSIVLSGMSDEAQMADNLATMKDFKPLSDEEQAAIAKAREALAKTDQIPCTACRYCVAGCPAGIHIPDIFAVMNVYKMYGDLARARNSYTWRPGGSPASKCVECGQCEGACPQHLPIINYLKEVVKTLE